MWLRRRWPVGLAVIVGVFAIYSVSASAIALIALFTVAVHRRLRTAVLVAGGYALTSFLTLLVRRDVSPPNWWQSLLGVVCVVAVLALGMFVRARRQLALVERERAASDTSPCRPGPADERNRIAREMHDVLAHRLSLLSLQAGALELWPDAPSAEIARSAGVIRSNAHGALEDLREVIGVLRAVQADDDRADDHRADDHRADGMPEGRSRPWSIADAHRRVTKGRDAGGPGLRSDRSAPCPRRWGARRSGSSRRASPTPGSMWPTTPAWPAQPDAGSAHPRPHNCQLNMISPEGSLLQGPSVHEHRDR